MKSVGQDGCAASLCDSPIVKRSRKLKETKSNFNKGKELTNLNYQDNSDDSEDDVQEAVKTLEIGKQLGLYAELEDKILKNITKL
jgi:hypothetical protein